MRLKQMAQGLSISIPIGWEDRASKLAFALERGLGLEVTAFLGAAPLEDTEERRGMERRLVRELHGFPGPLSFHGAFADLAIHSVDPQVAAFSRDRIERDIHTAMVLGCGKIVFHTGYNPLIPARYQRENFLRAHGRFWSRVASEYPGISICLENQWERDPNIVGSILDRVSEPSLWACVDVAHVHAHSSIEPGRWLESLSRHVAHVHVNDNHGDEDSHLPVGDGSIDWVDVFAAVDRLPSPPSVVVEVRAIEGIARSLDALAEVGVVPVESGPLPASPP